jgi:hypothetical protein
MSNQIYRGWIAKHAFVLLIMSNLLILSTKANCDNLIIDNPSAA